MPSKKGINASNSVKTRDVEVDRLKSLGIVFDFTRPSRRQADDRRAGNGQMALHQLEQSWRGLFL